MVFSPRSTNKAEQSDDQLMLGLSGKDQRVANLAFRALFDRHSAKLLGFCTRMMGDRNRGEDMAQEVWLQLVTRSSQYEGQEKFVAWLFTLGRNRCLSELRATKKWRESISDAAEIESLVDFDQASVENVLSIHEDQNFLKQQIDLLPSAQRAALVMWMTQECSYEEVAKELNVTLSAAKATLFRAKQNLEKSLRQK
jgi:RNA polymerase sigma-70 factor (ECF subfamily)